MSLDFLPEKLSLDGTFDQMISRLYAVFYKDLKQGRLIYKGKGVAFDKRYIGSEYEEGFWHLVTQGKSNRLLDFKRAKRLTWLRSLVENSDDPSLYKWIELSRTGKRKNIEKTYIWYREGRYVIVLADYRKHYFLKTAFYVTGAREEENYLRKFQAAQKKGPGC